MAVDERVESLRTRHEQIERALEEYRNRPYANATEQLELKRKKLRIKDEINRLMN